MLTATNALHNSGKKSLAQIPMEKSGKNASELLPMDKLDIELSNKCRLLRMWMPNGACAPLRFIGKLDSGILNQFLQPCSNANSRSPS